MSSYIKYFENSISKIKQEGRYRDFLNIQRMVDKFPVAKNLESGKEIVMWCINDYLGMGQDKSVIDAGIDALNTMGAGAGGTRNIGGNNKAVVELESIISKFHSREASLVFTSGYVANDACLTTISKIIPDIVFFSDEDNHSSIINGIRNSRADKLIYRHLDTRSLEENLKKIDINRPKMIVFESVYSMDGLESNTKEICALAKEYNALTYIDEVHTVGLYGDNGSGIARERKIDHEIDIIQGTLGKAIGVFGGYISARKEIIDAIRSAASGFIFTTALPPAVAASAHKSISMIMESSYLRDILHSKISYLKKRLEENHINFLENNSHIIPIIIGDPDLARLASRKLLDEHSIFVQHINYPTVPKGTERLRITLTPAHTNEMINHLVESLRIVLKDIAIKGTISEVA